jgi:hypothetical protein
VVACRGCDDGKQSQADGVYRGMNSRRLVFALAIGAQLSCVSTPPRVAAATPHDPGIPQVELLAPATDLTGGWATGVANEPPAGPVTQHPTCAYNPAVWIIEQSGNSLKAWAFPESFNQGIKRADPGPQRIAGSPGTISGVDVRIADDEARFVLRFDAESGHLRGTRNGVPFWAARQIIARTEACPGIP